MRPRNTIGFPKGYREKREDAQRAMDFHAKMAGKDPVQLAVPLPPKRARTVAGSDGRPLEREIQRDVLGFLKHHPKVAFVGRFNRGKFSAERNGKRQFYAMNTIPGFPDVHGMLKSGVPFYFEAKRPGENPTPVQQDFLDLAAKHGALSGVVRCIADAFELLKTA